MTYAIRLKDGIGANRFDAYYHQERFLALEKALESSPFRIDRLHNVVEHLDYGLMPTEDYAEDVQSGEAFIRVTNILPSGDIDLSDVKYIPSVTANQSTKRVRANDIIMVQCGSTTGKVAIVPDELDGSLYASFCFAIRAKSGTDQKYLFHVLGSRLVQEQIQRTWNVVSVRPNTSKPDVEGLSVPLPTLPVQHALVSKMEAARESRRRKLAEADTLLSGLDAFLLDRLGLRPPPPQPRLSFAVRLNQLVGRRIDAPAYQPLFGKGEKTKMPLMPLADVAEIEANTVPKPKDEEELVPYVGLPECELTEVREVVMRPYREVRGRGIAKPSDILFARIEPSVFNKKYVLAEDLKAFDYAYVSTEFYTVRAKTDLLEQGYLYAMFFSAFVYNQVLGKTTGSSGRRRIDAEMFANLKIPVPEKAVQLEISNELRRRRMEARRLREEAAREWDAAKARFEARLLGK